ncbi:MAG: hypothetical protein KAX33_01660 [Candidatus Lokiarchaeota archaeon]|nr:hypothetical protein [Candidatus Lokiarchaeota archaeon]
MSLEKIDIEKINEIIKNKTEDLNTLKGFGIIAESIIYKVFDIFGRNALLNMLYQVGTAPGEKIAKRLKEKYNKEVFGILESFELLLGELKQFYSVQIKDIEEDEEKIRFIIENKCFLRDSYKIRKRLKPGKAFCRVNKGYFEKALKEMLGETIKRVEINFLDNNVEKDVCEEEIIFYK